MLCISDRLAQNERDPINHQSLIKQCACVHGPIQLALIATTASISWHGATLGCIVMRTHRVHHCICTIAFADGTGSVLLDPAAAFAIDPAEVKRLSLEGFSVLGAARTAQAGEDTGDDEGSGFSVEAIGGVGAAVHSQHAATLEQPW